MRTKKLTENEYAIYYTSNSVYPCAKYNSEDMEFTFDLDIKQQWSLNDLEDLKKLVEKL